jgi:ketosteroid isomerase-like protein
MTTTRRTADLTESTLETIERFNDAFNRHDVEAVMALMTGDCVFENTSPAPDGERYEGQVAVRAFWERLFAGTPSARFTTEDLFAAGDRAAQAWRYDWTDATGAPGHVRGVDVFRVRDGKVAEKRSYVKG